MTKIITKIFCLSSIFLFPSSALSGTCPPGSNLYNDLIAWNHISVTDSEPILNNLTAWIETKKGKFDCDIEMMNTQGISLQLKCANKSTISQYDNNFDSNIYVTDANNSQFKMQVNTKNNISCFDDYVIEQQITEAFQQSFQFNIILEYNFQRKKVSAPVGF